MLREIQKLEYIRGKLKTTGSARLVQVIAGLSALFWCLICSLVQAEEPRVMSLVPGIKVQRLPVEIKNINSVEYGADGRLYAAGYDGRVHVLTDSDGDGIEDNAKVFWEKSGDLLTPVGILPAANGVHVAARGKIALLKDSDQDGIADSSETIVSNWVSEQHNSDTRNDAAGLAIDATGNLYFSLGCMSYNKAWQLDDKGNSQYDIGSERGTILKVSPDRKRREVLATGLRFIIGLDFNRHGDLFATDQEGDTWFPGGNSRDELLHIIPGRHYGFPFRHPKHLPDSIDEPAVVGFSPQHQSTCGFRFNENRDNRKPFGPKHWEGDAIVTGFSRGKLWRVPLARSRAGYVGKQIQFLAFESLPADVAVSPDGDLLVTCHSGRPDWGSGPAAEGHLYKVTFDHSTPNPVAAWPVNPLEVRIAFDRPIDPNRIQLPQIEMGEFVWEGDGYEWIQPGYEVVTTANAAVRRPLDVGGVTLSKDRRTVTVATAVHPWRTRYGIKLDGIAAVSESAAESAGETAELSYDLTGAVATWTAKGESQPAWSGWLPHADFNVVRRLTAGSAEHEKLPGLVQQPGELIIQSRLHLPGNEVAFRFESSSRFEIKCDGRTTRSKPAGNEAAVDGQPMYVCEFSMTAKQPRVNKDARGGREQVLPSDEVPIEIVVQTGATARRFDFDASYQADFDPHDRPLRLEHLYVPWAPVIRPPDRQDVAELTTRVVEGDPVAGREVFFSEEAKCATCHTYAGQGGQVGPDLTTSAHRDPASLLREIIDPNAAINPDYVSYIVETADGRTIAGLIQATDSNHIVIVDAAAKSHHISRADIVDLRANPLSLMPTGLEKLGEEKLRNLVAYLCIEDMVAKKAGRPTGVILREYWLDIPSGQIEKLTSDKRFPDKPDGSGLLTQFETPVNWKENFGVRITGHIHPPQDGDYTFWMAADDYAELWLSTSDDPAAKRRIIDMKRWVPSRAWEKYPEQKSKPIRLEAGKRYYIEALQTEGTVDDCLAVGWQLPDGKMERPVPGTRLSTAIPSAND